MGNEVKREWPRGVEWKKSPDKYVLTLVKKWKIYYYFITTIVIREQKLK